jgi:membrane-bound ClpP family serine protease
MLAMGLGLFAIAFLLLIAEVFIPTAGTLGITAGVVAIAGVVCLWRYDTTWGVTSLLALLVLAPMAVAFMFRIWPHTPLGRRIIGAKSPEELDQDRKVEADERAVRQALVGKLGVALSDLRPVGAAEIEGVRYEVICETSWLRTGAKVRVSAADFTQVKVRPVSE